MTAAAAVESESDAPVPPGVVVDLRAWMNRWQYTPNLQFVRLERVSPTEWPQGSRQSIAGALVDLYEPMDSFEVSAVWGGGIYTVTAVQVGEGNNRRIVERKRIELAGPPRAIPGPDGRPVPIPQMATAWGAAPQPAAQGNVVDLTQALARVNAGVSEANSIAAIKEAFAAAQQAIAAQDRQHRTELQEMRKELAKTGQDRDQPVRDALAAQQKQFDRIIESHATQLDALRAQHETQLASALRGFEKTMETREAAHRAELVALRDQQRQEVAGVRDTHRIETEGLKRDLERERSERDRDVRELRGQLDAARSEAASAGDRRATEARETAKSLYEPQLAQLRSELVEARKTAEQMRQDGREDLRSRENDIRAQLEAVSIAKESAIRSSLETRITSLEADIRSRDDRLDRQERELAQLRQQAMEKADPTTGLKQMGAIKDLVMGITGPQVAPGPQGFLQNFAAVAGPLRENVFEPILKRVDQGLQVAEQESQRRFQAQQVLFARGGAAAGRRKHRVTQRQLVQRQIAGRAAPAAARQAPQGTAPSAQAPPPSANPQNQQNAVAILQQLEAWLNDGTTPEAAAAQIRAAVQSGTVPADIYQSIVQQTTKELVNDVTSTAQQLGLAALSSPRGEDYLVALHKLLKRG